MRYKDCLGQLQKGDLIAIAEANYLHIGIFSNFGKMGNTNFWRVNKHWLDWIKQNENDLRRIRKDYITRGNGVSVVKIDVNVLDQERKDMYEEMLNILKNNKLV